MKYLLGIDLSVRNDLSEIHTNYQWDHHQRVVGYLAKEGNSAIDALLSFANFV